MCLVGLVGLVCLVCLVGLFGLYWSGWSGGSGWLGGSGCFRGSLFYGKMTLGGHFFINCGVFFIDFWSSEVTFLDILVSRGCLSTCLVPWRGLGAKT